MQIEIKETNGLKSLVITMPIAPATSKSGKSMVIASTHGNIRTMTDYDGKPITIGVNAYVSK